VKIKILPSALADLDRGRIFYARQSKGIGDYFLDSLFSDIDSLELYAGVHIKVFDFHRQLLHTQLFLLRRSISQHVTKYDFHFLEGPLLPR